MFPRKLSQLSRSALFSSARFKYKDPGCPTIACMIGDTKVERALLDLGVSVNLLPYSVCVQLGLGKLIPTSAGRQLCESLERNH
jgi:hypothetical protein